MPGTLHYGLLAVLPAVAMVAEAMIRAALPRPVELHDRRGQREAHQAQGIPDGQEPELGRDRGSALRHHAPDQSLRRSGR